MSNPTLYLIGNAHLDPVWLWRWPEGFSEARATCRAAVELLEQNPDLRFCWSSAGVLEWVVDLEPGILRRIRRLIRQGRWEVVNGWWEQPDCNLPGGESFVRQGLYGQRFFRDRLGCISRIGYNIDSFGHHANLPQILRKSGMPFYVFMRPSSKLENDEIPPSYFEWEGIDGTRVTAFHVTGVHYNLWDGQVLKKLGVEEAVQVLRRTGERSAMVFYGVGDHGGGPTRELITAARGYMRDPAMPRLQFATVAEAFQAMADEKKRRPLFKGELQHHASGCYAAFTQVKLLNRRAEETLLAAERMSVAAALVAGRRYPRASLSKAWKDVLFNQFHDILAGSSVREAYTDVRDQMGRALFTAESDLQASQQALAGQVDTRGEGLAVFVFNSHPFAVRRLIETEDLARGGWRGVNLDCCSFYDAAGNEITTQNVAASSHNWCRRLVFQADLPALGYRVYHLRNASGRGRLPARRVMTGGNRVENGILRITAGQRGVRIRDLRRKREVLAGGGFVPVVIADPSDTWGHDYRHFENVVGRFVLKNIKVVEAGPLRGRLRLSYTYKRSRLWLDLLLGSGDDSVELRGKLHWMERLAILKLQFPVRAVQPVATHEIPYAALERPTNGEEEPVQQWVDVAGPQGGLAVINDGRPSVSVRDNVLSQTIVRNSPFAWQHTKMYSWPVNHPFSEEDWYQDHGDSEFRLLLVPHAGHWRSAGLMERARLFSRSPDVLLEGTHPGRPQPVLSLIEVEGQGVRVEVIKEADDRKGWIVRAVETTGRRSRAIIRLPHLGARWSATFTPWEIKTFRIRQGRVAPEPMLEDLQHRAGSELATGQSVSGPI